MQLILSVSPAHIVRGFSSFIASRRLKQDAASDISKAFDSLMENVLKRGCEIGSLFEDIITYTSTVDLFSRRY
jgi:hypothetical protein